MKRLKNLAQVVMWIAISSSVLAWTITPNYPAGGVAAPSQDRVVVAVPNVFPTDMLPKAMQAVTIGVILR